MPKLPKIAEIVSREIQILAIFGSFGDFGNVSVSHHWLPINTGYFRMYFYPVLRNLRKRCGGRRHGMVPCIALFAVLRNIEALNFVVLRNAEADHQVDNLENYQRAHNRQRSSDR